VTTPKVGVVKMESSLTPALRQQRSVALQLVLVLVPFFELLQQQLMPKMLSKLVLVLAYLPSGYLKVCTQMEF
jgi:hypothetical protein